MEITYDQPPILKKLFGLFKAMDVRDRITMNVTPQGMNMFVVGHSKKVYTEVDFPGAVAALHYCNAPMSIDLPAAQAELAFQPLNKGCISVSFLLEGGKKTQIRISMRMESGATSNRDILLIEPLEEPGAFVYEDMGYPITLRISPATFKEQILAISRIARDGTFQITQAGKTPLAFLYDGKRGGLVSRDEIEASDCEVESLLDEHSVVCTALQTEYVSPLSSSQLASKWELKVDNKRPLLIRGELEKWPGVVIRTSIIVA
jgi:hypothetical protein